jgi:hypothetical protein
MSTPKRDDRGAVARKAAKTERGKSVPAKGGFLTKLLDLLTKLSPKK